MGSTPDLRRLTAAYKAMLQTVTGRPWGDLDAPGDLDTPTDKPYGLLGRMPSGARFGDPARPVGMARVVYQLTVVGERADQADWLMDKALDATFALGPAGYVNPITAAGLLVIGRGHDTDGGVITEGAVVNSIQRVALTVTAT